ncbi:hypothetical protein B0H19DRAFT_966714 [Mycena capillaripes]|nr:hypothetical protein B0H19DRAFT_966714 [Mycena capillaripes]
MDSAHPNSSVPRSTRSIYWNTLPVSQVEATVIDTDVLQWEVYPEPVAPLRFPPADLLRDLVEIYFTQINIFSFILHRPTFERSLVNGLHFRDRQFGSVVLAVCALASKNSPDKRVLLAGAQGEELSAGWEWFGQIRRPFSGAVIKTATLYELQLCCLYISFQHTGSDIESCWLLTGIGILHAQDIGADRLMTSNAPVTVENELIKRSCYFFSVFDSIISACFGRPRVASSNSCDLARPLAVDDEYWEQPDPQMAFKQPPGKPSLSEYNIAYVNLIKIFSFEWRWNSVDDGRSRVSSRYVVSPQILKVISARLNKWASEIPEHLLWNPYQEDDIFFEQSAALYASFYHIQILAHRPFIQAPNASTLKSLAICTNAARSCSTVADVKSRRGFLPSHHFVKAVFDSAIVLLLNISGGTRSGLSIDTERELADVYKCMTLLRQTETR